MEIIDKKLVIIGSNEYSETSDGCFFRSGLEPQMEDLAKYFKECVHYSPKSKHIFKGYKFDDHVKIKPFSIGHHESHRELWQRKREYWKSIKFIYSENRGAIFMVFFPDSYIGLISAIFLKLKKAKFFVRITSNQLEEMKVRGDKWYRKIIYYLVKPIYIGLMKWLFYKVPQVYTGDRLFYKSIYSFSVNSSNLRKIYIKKKQIVKKEKVDLLYVGRFDYYKGLYFLMDIISELKIDFKLRIVGFGNAEETERLKNIISLLPKKENIVLIGQVEYGEKLFAIYDESDILLVPAFYETQGKTYLEAMARGVAVIASNVGGIPRIVKNNENGILVEPGDKRALLNAIEKLAKDYEQRNKLVANGYKIARENTIDSITSVTLRAISFLNI